MADDELEQQFETRVERFSHRGVAFDLLLPGAAEALIDEAEFEADERLPYWAELWPSARALTRHLLTGEAVRGRALELGCGVALPSLALLARGTDVLATDYYPDALRFARANARRNALPSLRARLLDWRAVPASFGRFDLVIAADVLYEQRNAVALSAVLPRLVTRRGRVLLADPGRRYLDEFRRRIEQPGWTSRELAVYRETSDAATAAVSRIQILELRAPAAPITDDRRTRTRS